jgi:putative endonuclease
MRRARTSVGGQLPSTPLRLRSCVSSLRLRSGSFRVLLGEFALVARAVSQPERSLSVDEDKQVQSRKVVERSRNDLTPELWMNMSSGTREKAPERSRRGLTPDLPLFLETLETPMKCHMYILKCADGSYYTGSTKNLSRRLAQHQKGEGANFTRKHLPVKLVYSEEYTRIDEAFYREKEVQGWNRAKKEALINGEYEKLPELAECRNETRADFGRGAAPFDSAQGAFGCD